jgi:hypothetical protein
MNELQRMVIDSEIDPEDAVIDLRFEVMASMEDLKTLKFCNLDPLNDLMRMTHALAPGDQIRKLQKHVELLQILKTHLTQTSFV